MAQADPILSESNISDIANPSLALIRAAEGVLQDMQEDIKSTQALAELIQDFYLRGSYRNPKLSALIDANQNRTSYALEKSEERAADIEAVFACAEEQAGIKDETRNTEGATDVLKSG